MGYGLRRCCGDAETCGGIGAEKGGFSFSVREAAAMPNGSFSGLDGLSRCATVPLRGLRNLYMPTDYVGQNRQLSRYADECRAMTAAPPP